MGQKRPRIHFGGQRRHPLRAGQLPRDAVSTDLAEQMELGVA
jgi:hypothetical protein